ncbi:ABC transporter permease [Microbacterium testaceum]|uniref:ABC transporter permease n=1 Tax=Microbacterium testaceum TaxID=2033 RepID=UPI0021CB1A06|nr:ABC transporter permease [Microbacterium testaceum]
MSVAESMLRTVVSVLLLGGVAVVVLRVAGVQRWWGPAPALLRAGVQLAALSLVLAGIITNPWWVSGALAVMFFAAVTVSTRRAGVPLADAWRTAAAMGTGVSLAGVVVFSSGAVELTPRYALAVGAMVVGNAMTVATLAGRHFAQARVDKWSEVEAWLALGANPKRAVREVARIAVHDALIPALDQTRTTGLVVLPGAFVGAIFGGLSPIEAGRFQLVVLAAILASGTITAVLTVRLTSRVAVRPSALR